MYTNDNQCKCGHAKVEHLIDMTFAATACSLNQKICDCWQYEPRATLSEHALTLSISHEKIKYLGGI
jgi:hypothetical protein